MIERELTDLARELRVAGVRGRAARRVLAEARDHLVSASATRGESAALQAFGEPRAVARAVAAELATIRTRTGIAVTFTALGLLAAVFAAAWLTGPASGLPEGSGSVAWLGALAVFCLILAPQVAFVAGGLAALRVFRLRSRGAQSDGELAVQRRRAVVALAAGALTLAALVTFAFDYRDAVAGWWFVLVVASAPVLAGGMLAAALAVLRSTRPAAHAGVEAEDVFDDLAPLLSLAPFVRLELSWHPWRFAALVAVTAALGVALAGLAAGDPIDGLLRATMEATAVLAGFAVFGRTLALRRN